MNGREFVRRARGYAKRTGQAFRIDARRGKGSHGMLYVGNRRTVVKHGELKPRTFRNMLKQLEISREDF